MAENMPSGAAQRPSDVLTTYGGRTVEVLNTDAEGRLVLADGIVAASEEHPDLIVDVATLTGHQVVALGTRVSAVMSNDDAPARARSTPRPTGPASSSGRCRCRPSCAPAWTPRSPTSRTWASGWAACSSPACSSRSSSATKDGSEDQIPWAHLDIAGPSFNTDKPFGYTPKGGTGVAVRTLVALAEDLAAARIASGLSRRLASPLRAFHSRIRGG